MPRLDDPNSKIKKLMIFKRESLRPWDDAENFKPTIKVAENYKENVEENKTISNELANKTATIGKQKANDLVNKWESKGDQISKHAAPLNHPVKTIGKQLVSNKKTNGNPDGNQSTFVNGKQLVNHGATVKEDFHEIVNKIKTLVGLQKVLLYYIVENCKSRGLLYTDKITNELLRGLLNTDAHSVKTTVQRIIIKGLIARKEGKRGKGGFTVFEIHEIIRNAVIDEQRQINISQQYGAPLWFMNSKQIVNNLETNRRANVSSSSSSIYNKTTTTELEEINANDFTINIAPLSNIGLTQGHIVQLTKQQKLTFEQIQDSINYFAFDLARNEKAKTLRKDALNFFMGILRQGLPYTPPNNYESPEAEAMRLHLESKVKAKKINEQLEKEFKESLWQEWRETLSEQELMEFYIPGEPLDSLSEKVRAALKRRNATASAYQYFESEIWPLKLKEIVLAKSSALIG